MTFDHDWWYLTGYADRVDEAKRRCAKTHFPDLDPAKADKDRRYKTFYSQLEARTILYLRDGFSYELKELIPQRTTTCLTFECNPADEAYRVGAFVVTLPFDDIVRVEIYAVHPEEKPENTPAIQGFAAAQAAPLGGKRPDDRPQPRPEELERTAPQADCRPA